MNRLIIVGNGFDLAHGLKTGYGDFIKDYLIQCFREVIKFGVHDDLLLKITRSGSQFSPDSYSSLVSGELSFNKIIERGKNLNLTIKLKSDLLRNLFNSIETKNWVDIESEYYKLLVDFYKEAEKRKITPINFDITQTTAVPLSLNNHFNFLKEKVINYLSKQVNNFNLDNYDYSKLVSCFNERVMSDAESISPTMNLLKTTKIDKTKILNFNYSPLIRKYIDSNQILRTEEIPIHGEIEEGKSIVFGYGDELDEFYQKMEDLNENSYFEHIKSFKYFDNSHYQDLMKFLVNDFEVYVMGHSLGISDRTMLSQIFQAKECKSIKFFYYDRGNGTTDYVDKSYEISRHFKDKGEMRLKIVPFTKCEPFPNVPKIK